MAYLVDNPPVRDQWRDPRRGMPEGSGRPTGCIVVHTAESVADVTLPDASAENVAAFIRTRTTPGSYHELADADTCLYLVPYEYEAYGDATGSNRWAIHVSGAVQAGKWATYPQAHRDAVVKQMAFGAARAAKWLKAEHGITVPARRITRAQSDAGQPGFISHAERDPSRRTDPGAGFDWDLFLAEYTRLMDPTEEDDMTPEQAKTLADIKAAVDGLRSEEAGRYVTATSRNGDIVRRLNLVQAAVGALDADTDPADIARRVLAGMSPDLAKAVVAQMAATLAQGSQTP